MNGAIIVAIASNLGFAFGDVGITKIARRVGGLSAAYWVAITSIILSVPLLLFFKVPEFTVGIIALTVVLAAILELGTVGYTIALEKGNAPLVGAIAGAFPALVVILSVIFYGERLNVTETAAIIAVIVGIVLSSLDVRSLSKAGRKKVETSITLALFAFVTWGVYFTFVRTLVEQLGWAWANALELIFGTIFIRIVLNKRIKKFSALGRNSVWLLVFVTALTEGSTMAFNFAIENGESSIIAPIVGGYSAVFVLLAHFFFKDSLNKQQLVGVILTLAGVIALTIVS